MHFVKITYKGWKDTYDAWKPCKTLRAARATATRLTTVPECQFGKSWHERRVIKRVWRCNVLSAEIYELGDMPDSRIRHALVLVERREPPKEEETEDVA